jgi:hypothetical protein
MRQNIWKILTITIGVVLILCGFIIWNSNWQNKNSFLSLGQKKETALSIETALIFKSGDVKPVARTEFHLLDKNFETVLQESNFISVLPLELKGTLSKISLMKAFALLAKSAEKNSFDSPETTQRKAVLILPLAKVVEATKSHILHTVTTDFQGKATFNNIRPGEYFLFGYSSMGGSLIIWNHKVNINEGTNSLVLDQNNAATSSD